MPNKKTQAFLTGESHFEGGFDHSLWRDLRMFWSRYFLLVGFLFMVGLISRSFLLSISLVIGSWADSLCGSHQSCQGSLLQFNFSDPWQYLQLSTVLLGLGTIGTGVFLIGIASTGAKVSQLIHNETIMRVSRFPMQLLDRTPVGQIYTRFSSDFNHLLMANGPHLAQIGMIILDIFIMFIIITFIDYRLSLLCVPFIALDAIIYRRSALIVRDLRRSAASARSPSISHFSSTIKGFLSIELFGKRNSFVGRFERLVKSYYRERSAADFAFYFFGLKISLITALLMLLLSLVSIFLIQSQQLSIGSAGVVISYIAIIASFIQRLFTLITSLEQGLTGVERIHEYIRKPIEFHALLPSTTVLAEDEYFEENSVKPFISDQVSIKVENLWFRYSEKLPWILKDFNLDIEAGKSLGIIGRTGSGKSSLFQVLLQLYVHEKGEIKINEFTIADQSDPASKKLSLTDWRSHFSFITQEPRIFRASILENLDPTLSCKEKDIIDIVDRVGLKDWLLGFKDGLDYELSEDGSDMSTGQRQQLATARCLLRKAPIVLMDEATSAVDPQSEEFFLQATRELLRDKTRLIIAHRLTTVYDCDYVAWLKDGKIHRFGKPGEVIREFKLLNPSEAE